MAEDATSSDTGGADPTGLGDESGQMAPPAGAVWAGVDGSEDADRAVAWAARYAHSHGLPLQLVYVVTVPSIFYSEPMAVRFVEDEREQMGTHLLRAAARTARAAVGGGELTIGAQYEQGSPSEALISCTADAHLLVLGTRGHGELTGLFVGSVTRAVVAHARCPTVVVPHPPEGVDDPALRSDAPVVVGVDGSPSGQAALDLAYQEAEARGVELVAVHVWSDAGVQPFMLGSRPEDAQWRQIQRREEEKLGEVVADRAPRYPDTWVRQFVEHDSPVRVLGAWSKHAQLIVIGTRGRGGFAGLVMGATSNALLHRTQCPLMVVRPAE